MGRRLAALLLVAAGGLLLAGCAGEERPWEAHLKDKASDAAIPDLTPRAPAAPTSPQGGLNPSNAPPVAADPDAPPPVTDANPGALSDDVDDPSDAPAAAGGAAASPDAAAPERGPTDRDAPAERGSASSRESSTNATATARRGAPSTAATGRLNESRRRRTLPPPSNRAERIAADKRAMLDLRTMVSIIEGCNSGRESYERCNTHSELGGPEVLGLEIGRQSGQIQVSATRRGFRITTVSRSGAKFTMARGPAGDRFRCIPGPQPGACPASRTWGW